MISEEIRKELYSYIGGICNNMECSPITIGGYDDHVHILCLLSKKVTLMKLLQEVKASSSKWIKSKGEEFSKFYWQDGYGEFSVNYSQVDVVIAYIENQEEHHGKKNFQEEYRAILTELKVEYDERYVWD